MCNDVLVVMEFKLEKRHTKMGMNIFVVPFIISRSF